jgi:ABC-type transport system involved in cytochrome bd biosynthesis fused ATPase/permease subunit
MLDFLIPSFICITLAFFEPRLKVVFLGGFLMIYVILILITKQFTLKEWTYMKKMIKVKK